MGILSTNIQSMDDQATRLIHLYEKITYVDGLGEHNCIVLNVDDNYKPTLVGKLITNSYIGQKTIVPQWSVGDLDKNCGRPAIKYHYDFGWYCPDISWYQERFGKTYKEMWDSPDHTKFRRNIFDGWTLSLTLSVRNIEFLTRSKYPDHFSTRLSDVDKWLENKNNEKNENLYGVFISSFPPDTLNLPSGHIDINTPSYDVCSSNHHCFLMLMKNVKSEM